MRQFDHFLSRTAAIAHGSNPKKSRYALMLRASITMRVNP
jgi:hypothetical protein